MLNIHIYILNTYSLGNFIKAFIVNPPPIVNNVQVHSKLCHKTILKYINIFTVLTLRK